jgi:hypothetical protein
MCFLKFRPHLNIVQGAPGSLLVHEPASFLSRSKLRTSPTSISLFFAILSIVTLAFPATASDKHNLFPHPRPGQTFRYLIEAHTEKKVSTDSRVVTPGGPQSIPTESRWILRVEILDVQPRDDRFIIHARSQFQDFSANDALSASRSESEAKSVDFTILPDGHIEKVTGLKDLFPEQQEIWQQWLHQFAIAAIFPTGGVKPGQRWKTTQPESAPSPIVKLQWDKTATYVRDEPCAPTQLDDSDKSAPEATARPTPAPNAPAEQCAVVLTHAVLKQKSSPDDTTPGDFRIHNLQTSGNASGTNETISYISLTSGLIVRVKEDARQTMDVIVAKTDGSNEIHYNLDASSHTELLLLAPPAASNPQAAAH